MSAVLADDSPPSAEELESLCRREIGATRRVGYYFPSDVYAACVAKHVLPGCRWLDVGGGRALFPDHPALARELVARCARVVAVDPSEHVRTNDVVHERVKSALEDYFPEERFDLATLRMVVEHVERPAAFATALARALEPGGAAVVLTVDRRSPVSRLARLLPVVVRSWLKRRLWGGAAGDTFPVRYRMNTRLDLRRVLEPAGFEERWFVRLDDLSVFRRFDWLSALELRLWGRLRRVGLAYPECCLLAVYRRST